MKRLLLGLFAAITLIVGVTGCNTVRGAGEDIENVGESIDENT